MNANGFFYRITNGIRITVRPLFLPEQSSAERRQFVFAYFIRIENTGEKTAQLLTRHWRIHDSAGEDSEVEGDGVIGQQPSITPGGVHEYQSFCVLKSRRGHMEGTYHFVREDGSAFDAEIPRFEMEAEQGRGMVS